MHKPREVYDNPSDHLGFLTISSDDNFEGQYFERKEVARGNTKKDLEPIIKTISAFANSNNVEGGVLVLGIDTNGTIAGIDHLSEDQKNSLTNFNILLHHQTAEAKLHKVRDKFGNEKTICLVFVPHSERGICETLGQNPKAWIRSGSQNISVTQEMRDHIRTTKGLLDFENDPCCEFYPDDIDEGVLNEFRRVFHPRSTEKFSKERLLYEAGAIIFRDEKYWFTNAGLLFFGANPQRRYGFIIS